MWQSLGPMERASIHSIKAHNLLSITKLSRQFTSISTNMSSLQSFPANGGQGGQDIFSRTILGCPVVSLHPSQPSSIHKSKLTITQKSFQALETICPVTGYPACAAATPEASWDASCCGSIAVFGSSVGNCYSENAPSCLDLSGSC